jgi:DNA-binding MarR family transcriptional regulator
MTISLENLGLLVKKAQHRQHRALEAQLAPLGITLVQWNALREIDRNPGSTMHGLAELTFNSDQAFGTLVTRLMKMGFVERSPGLGRAMIHTLTRSGAAKLHECQQIVPKVTRHNFAPLSETDRAELARLLTLLVDSGQ